MLSFCCLLHVALLKGPDQSAPGPLRQWLHHRPSAFQTPLLGSSSQESNLLGSQLPAYPNLDAHIPLETSREQCEAFPMEARNQATPSICAQYSSDSRRARTSTVSMSCLLHSKPFLRVNHKPKFVRTKELAFPFPKGFKDHFILLAGHQVGSHIFLQEVN